MSSTTTDRRAPALGLRANLPQFLLLIGVNALVGGMVGMERTVLPLLAEAEFGLAQYAGILTFIVAFGISKAITNFFAGTLADRFGRKPVLIAGWLVGVPVPLLLIWAPAWEWVVFANVLLGVNQGLAWSITVLMKIDLVGPARRGLAMGLNEAAGYTAVSATAWATGIIAAEVGLRPEPFFLGLAFAGLGLGLAALVVRETSGHVATEAASRVSTATSQAAGPDAAASTAPALSTPQVFANATWRHRSLSAASQAGMVSNLKEGAAWGLFPAFFALGGLSGGEIGLLVAIAPGVWGVGQLLTGGLSDRVGRKWLIAGGMWGQAAGLATIAAGEAFAVWAVGSVVLGAGTAMAYPTLTAAISDVAHPVWRGKAVGAYRFWRDAGFAVGAIIAGVAADALGLAAAIGVVAGIAAVSGTVVAVRMAETRGAAIVGGR